jgi:hypothetical protein
MIRGADPDPRRVALIKAIYLRLDRAGGRRAAGLELDTLISAHVEARVAEEREACARVIEDLEMHLPDQVRGARYLRGSLAAALRARGQA